MKLATLQRKLRRVMEDNAHVLRSVPHPLKPGLTLLDYGDAALGMQSAKELSRAVSFVEQSIDEATPKLSPSRKRASYREGVAWIALNDEPTDLDPDSVASYISTALLADLFGKDTSEVAKAIVSYRRQRA